MAFESSIKVTVDAKNANRSLTSLIARLDKTAKSSLNAEDRIKSLAITLSSVSIASNASSDQIDKMSAAAKASGIKIDFLEKEVKKLNDQLSKVKANSASAATQIERNASSADKAAKSYKSLRGVAQNAGFQLQDVAVQAQAGTSALVILGQQGSQFAGAFGPTGAVVGAIIAVAAAIGSVFVPSLLDGKTNSDKLAESIESLSSILDSSEGGFLSLTERVKELSEESKKAAEVEIQFGIIEATSAVESSINVVIDKFDELSGLSVDFSDLRSASGELSKLDESGLDAIQTIDGLTSAYARNIGNVGRLSDSIDDLSDEFGISKESAVDFIRVLGGFSAERTPESMEKLRDQLLSISNAADGSSSKYAKFITEIGRGLEVAKTQVEQLAFLEKSLSDFSSGVVGASTQVQSLNKALQQQIAIEKFAISQSDDSNKVITVANALRRAGLDPIKDQNSATAVLVRQLIDEKEKRDALNKSIEDATGAYSKYKSGLDRAFAVNKKYDDLIQDITKNVSDNVRQTELINLAEKNRARDLDSLNRKIGTQKSETDKLIDSLNDQANALEFTLDATINAEAEEIRYTAAVAALNEENEEKAQLLIEAAERTAQLIEKQKEQEEQEKELEKTEKALKKAAEESDKAYEKLYDNLSDNLTDVITGYKDLEDVALSVAQNIARAFVQQNITAPILSGFGLQAPGGSAGAGGSLLSPSSLSSAAKFLSSPSNNLFLSDPAGAAADLFNFGSAGTSATGSLSAGAGGSFGADFAGASSAGLGGAGSSGNFFTTSPSSLASGVATAGAGYLGGSLAGSFGLEGEYSGELSAIYSAIGGAVAGPIGAAAGGFLGSAWGSLLGGKPSDKTQFSSIDLSADSIDIGGFEGEKFSQENRDAASLLGQSAIAVSKSLEAVSGKDITDAFNIIVGSRDAIRLETQAFNASGGLASDQATRFITETDPQKFADEVARFFASSIDVNLESFESLRNEGEILADAIVRVTNQAQIAGPLLEVIGINIGGLGDTALTSADLLIDAVGGIDALGVASQFYYANFFSEEERAQVVRDAAQLAIDEFNATLGLTGAAALDTRDELRDYIEGLDATTSAGAKAAGTALTFADEIAVLDDGLLKIVDTSGGVTDALEEIVDTTDLQIRLLSEQNKIEEALALTRQKQLESSSDAEAALLRAIFAQEDLNSANATAADLKAIAQEDQNKITALELQLLKAQGLDTESLNLARQLEIRGLSESEAAIRREIQAQEDAARLSDLNIRLIRTQGDEWRSLAISRQSELDSASEAERVVLRQIFAQENLNKALEDEADRKTDLISDMNDVFSSLSENIQDQRDFIEDSFAGQITAANDAISETENIVSSLDSAISSLSFDSGKIELSTRLAAQSFIRNALNSSGLPDSDDLSRALSVISEPSEDLFGTFEDYARDFVTTAKDIDNLQDKASSQLTVEEETLAAIEAQKESQLTALDSILSEAQEQIDQLEGVNQGLDTIDESLDELAKLLMQSATGGGSRATNVSNQEIRDFVSDNDVTPDGITDTEARVIYDAALATGTSLSQVNQALGLDPGEAEQWAIRNGLPTFANGGAFGGGVRMVGERGPELEFTGPSRIMSNSDMNDMMTNDSVVRELRELREITTSALMAVASNTKSIADINRAWDGDGLPQDRGY